MTAIATLPVLLQTGNHAGRPAASAVGSGALYNCTTHGLVYQQLAGSWGTWMTLPAAGFSNPMTTAEDIIYGGASGTPTRKAKGSDGTFLGVASGALLYTAVTDALLSTSDITTNNASTTKHGFAPKYPNDATKYLDGTGAYTVPAGGGGGGGGSLVWLQRQTAAGSGTLDFTGFLSSTYTAYLFAITNIMPATTNTNLLLRVGTGGGPTYDSGTNYGWAGWRWAPGGEAHAGGSSGQTSLGLDASGGVKSDAVLPYSGTFYLWNPQDTTAAKAVTGQAHYVDNSGTLIGSTFSGLYLSATALTAIRFLMSSGNITSGFIDVYGLTHA